MTENNKDHLRNKRKRKEKLGILQQKLLILFLGGLTLGLNRSPKNYFRILHSTKTDLRNIPKSSIERSLNKLIAQGYITAYRTSGGELRTKLTKRGTQEAAFQSMLKKGIVRPKKWDGLWRMVIFDIPEKKRLARDSLRYQLKTLGFVELQKSVVINPFPTHKILIGLKKFYQLTDRQVRLVLVDSFEGEKVMKKKFGL